MIPSPETSLLMGITLETWAENESYGIAVKEHTEKRVMMIHGIVSPEVAAFPEQMCHCHFAELWPLVPAWFCRDEEVCSAQQLSKGLLGMPRYSHCLFFLTFRGLC